MPLLCTLQCVNITGAYAGSPDIMKHLIIFQRMGVILKLVIGEDSQPASIGHEAESAQRAVGTKLKPLSVVIATPYLHLSHSAR